LDNSANFGVTSQIVDLIGSKRGRNAMPLSQGPKDARDETIVTQAPPHPALPNTILQQVY
jgi:hypothetical protein